MPAIAAGPRRLRGRPAAVIETAAALCETAGAFGKRLCSGGMLGLSTGTRICPGAAALPAGSLRRVGPNPTGAGAVAAMAAACPNRTGAAAARRYMDGRLAARRASLNPWADW